MQRKGNQCKAPAEHQATSQRRQQQHWVSEQSVKQEQEEEGTSNCAWERRLRGAGATWQSMVWTATQTTGDSLCIWFKNGRGSNGRGREMELEAIIGREWSCKIQMEMLRYAHLYTGTTNSWGHLAYILHSFYFFHKTGAWCQNTLSKSLLHVIVLWL